MSEDIEDIQVTEYTPGWHIDPEAVDAVASELQYPTFGDTPLAQLSDGDLPPLVLLTTNVKKLQSGHICHDQGSVGSCVSFGTSRAVEASNATEIINGDAEKFYNVVEEATYGGSRVEIGGGRLRGDGSIGAWAAKFVTQYGVINRGTHAGIDLSKYSPTRAKSWGATGVPAEIEKITKAHPVSNTTLVASWADAKKALANGLGISVCSNRGFSMRRDSQGFCAPSGSWQHCMALLGYRTDREAGLIVNSWGANSTTGPLGPHDIPACAWWATADVIDTMLKQKDSWAFAGVKGFALENLPHWVF
jgi:hypothetical protein